MTDSTNPRVMADNIKKLDARSSETAGIVKNLTTFSLTEEFDTGKRLPDGTVIYGKTFIPETIAGNTSTDYLISNDFDSLIDIYGRVVSGSYSIPVPYPAASGNLVITANVYQKSLRVTVGAYYVDANALSDALIIVEYTKATTP